MITLYGIPNREQVVRVVDGALDPQEPKADSPNVGYGGLSDALSS